MSYVDFMIVYEATREHRHVFMQSLLPRDEANWVSFRLCLAYYGPCGRFGSKNSLKNLAFRIPYTPLLLPTHNSKAIKIDGELASRSSQILLSGTELLNLTSVGRELRRLLREPKYLCKCSLGSLSVQLLLYFLVVLLFQQVGMCSSTYVPIGKLGHVSTDAQ